MTGAAWVFLTALAGTSLLLVVAVGGNADLARQLRVARLRERWAMERLLVDAVADGWVPEPEMVGLSEADVAVLELLECPTGDPAEFDVDDCRLCGGTGMYAVRQAGVADRCSWVDCPGCTRGGGRRD